MFLLRSHLTVFSPDEASRLDGGWATIFEIATVMSFCLDPTRKLTASRSHFRKTSDPTKSAFADGSPNDDTVANATFEETSVGRF